MSDLSEVVGSIDLMGEAVERKLKEQTEVLEGVSAAIDEVAIEARTRNLLILADLVMTEPERRTMTRMAIHEMLGEHPDTAPMHWPREIAIRILTVMRDRFRNRNDVP